MNDGLVMESKGTYRTGALASSVEFHTISNSQT